MLFRDREEAGRKLATKLSVYAGRADVLVLAIPRGGVAVGFEIAAALDAPLDVVVVRKLGVPGREELAFGAVASGGELVLNEDIVEAFGLPPPVIGRVAQRELTEIARREGAYRCGRPPLDPRQQRVILVDDGLATGATMRVAIKALAKHELAAVVVAVPVSALEAVESLEPEVDDFVVLATPVPFLGVGQWYDDFRQMSDHDVCTLVERAHQRHAMHA
jgi:putative phosphoribosyl transferase